MAPTYSRGLTKVDPFWTFAGGEGAERTRGEQIKQNRFMHRTRLTQIHRGQIAASLGESDKSWVDITKAPDYDTNEQMRNSRHNRSLSHHTGGNILWSHMKHIAEDTQNVPVSLDTTQKREMSIPFLPLPLPLPPTILFQYGTIAAGPPYATIATGPLDISRCRSIMSIRR